MFVGVAEGIMQNTFAWFSTVVFLLAAECGLSQERLIKANAIMNELPGNSRQLRPYEVLGAGMGTQRKGVKDIDRKLAAYRRMRFERMQKQRRTPKKPTAQPDRP